MRVTVFIFLTALAAAIPAVRGAAQFAEPLLLGGGISATPPSAGQCPVSVTFNPSNPTITPPQPAGSLVSHVTVQNLAGTNFTGTTSLTTNPNNLFALVGSSQPDLVFTQNITPANAGTYMPVISATGGNGTCQTIDSITPTSATFTGGSPDGTVVAPIGIAMNPATPAFSGTLRCTEGGLSCTHFRLSSATLPSNLLLNGTQSAGTYSPTITATQTTIFNSPFSQTIAVTGTGTVPVISSINLSNGSSFTIPANSGSTIDVLSATCTQGSCAGAAFQLATQAGCTSTGNGSFAVSGTNLNIGGTTINDTTSRTICLEAQVSGAANFFQSFTLTGSAPGASNCPSSPPAQAAAAGYNTLIYCLDPTSTTYANIPSWLDCNSTNVAGFQWYIELIPPDAQFSCGNNWSMSNDPVTGKVTLHYHHFSNTDTAPATLGNPVSNNIATAQSLSAAGNLTLNGFLTSGGIATLPNPYKIAITSTANESAIKFTVTGTNAQGQPQSEGYNGTFITLNNYKTVTQISTTGATAGTITVGVPFPWPQEDRFGSQQAAYGFSTLPTNGEWPAGHYYEIRYRHAPGMTDNNMNGTLPDAFNFFEWAGQTRPVLERDIIEDYGARPDHAGQVAHDWFDCKGASPCFGNYQLWGTLSHLNPPVTALTNVHSIGWLSTTDGVSLVQSCGYIDNVRVQMATGSGNPNWKNCSIYDYSATTSPCAIMINVGEWPAGSCQTNWSIGNPKVIACPNGNPSPCNSPLNTRMHISAWTGATFGTNSWACSYYQAGGGGYNPTTNPSPCTKAGGEPDDDIYIEYIAVWSCAAYATDNTCATVGISPSAIVDAQINGGYSQTFTAPTTTNQSIGTLSARCVSGTTITTCGTGTTFTLVPVGGIANNECLGDQVGLNLAADNAKFTISGTTLQAIGGLTAGGGSLPNHNYTVCVRTDNPAANTHQDTPLMLVGQ